MKINTLFILIAALANVCLLAATGAPSPRTEASIAEMTARADRLAEPLVARIAAQTARTEALIAELHKRAEGKGDAAAQALEAISGCLRAVQDETLCAVSWLENCHLDLNEQKCKAAGKEYDAFMKQFRANSMSN